MNNQASATAVYGLQFGDEGKGKIIDYLSPLHDIGIRCQGGDNAGHTIYLNGEKLALHLIPSTIVQPSSINVIGNGVVLNPTSLMNEIEALQSKDIEINEKRLKVSDRAHLILPHHLALDTVQEYIAKIGTTMKGIGPAYTAKISRSGIRLCDVIYGSRERLKDLLSRELERTTSLFQHYYKISAEEFSETFKNQKSFGQFLHPVHYFNEGSILNWLDISGKQLQTYATDIALYLHKAYQEKHQRLLFEGAQGALLDIDFGTYPYVTSSNTGVAGIRTGSGLEVPFTRSIGIAKAYTTRVGGGPFTTELFDQTGEFLQTEGNEFGSTTGRKRRCGWLDMVALQYAVMINSPTEIVITKLDVLDKLDEIHVCVAYSLDGVTIDSFPPNIEQLQRCTPVYKTFKGWKKSISEITSYENLPSEAIVYLSFIEEKLRKRISIISVGKERNQTIMRSL